MIGRILFIIFFLTAFLEIAVFMIVGEVIGVGPTLLLILITAVLGAVLLKREGLATYRAAMMKMDRGETPIGELLDGLALFVAGALLLTPGFVTDAVGFALFIPAVRQRIGRSIAGSFASAHHKGPAGESHTFYYESHSRTRPSEPGVIDGEAVVIDEHEPGENGKPSKWSRPPDDPGV